MSPHRQTSVLIVEARFYEDLADEMAAGAIAVLQAAGASFERIAVPGALEIPSVLAMAADAGLLPYGSNRWKYHGCIALGCVIRGETSHYDIVANESVRWLMQVSTSRHIPLGTGILTVENRQQAWARARGGRSGKGGDAARACLRLVRIMCDFHQLA